MKHKLGTIRRPCQVHTKRPNNVQTTELRYIGKEQTKSITLINGLSDAQFDSTMKHKLDTIRGTLLGAHLTP